MNKPRPQLPLANPSGVDDASTRYNLDVCQRELQDLKQMLTGKNLFLSDSFTTTLTAAGIIAGAVASIKARGDKPILGAFIPAPYKEPVNQLSVPTVGGSSSLRLTATATLTAMSATLDIYRARDGVAPTQRSFWTDFAHTFGTTSETGRIHGWGGIIPLFFDAPGKGTMKYEVRLGALSANTQISFNALQLLLIEW